MADNSQWHDVIHHYGVGNRTRDDRSLGVDCIIKHRRAKFPDIRVDDDLDANFYETPLSFIFVNNNTIRASRISINSYGNDALTECELTFYQNGYNSVRFRYFLQFTHGCLIYDLSWVKSSTSVEFNRSKFCPAKEFIEIDFTMKMTACIMTQAIEFFKTIKKSFIK